ncbi:signal transduction histidine kinase [Allocatelliglobosispora scoriae]|uniref:Oxygen sensor histidine kinase NreB n=1 Tax=Allocatelliglobosispora scoriae TaxID=643052 RepID=A0A841C064_9ACTN|nr:sensor histidine kinase [Allocatelliglobosispora scoriae]MBB5873774.1 signal transduction histidine kinase [Allocatelliglobosispora scoriae]
MGPAELSSLCRAHHDAGVLAERDRIALELHDTFAQGFAGILLLIQAAEVELATDPAACGRRLASAARTARENLRETRTMVATFAAGDPEPETLPATLGTLVRRFGRERGVTATFSASGGTDLPYEQHVTLLRAAQEALANAGRHSGASRVDVRLSRGDTEVTLEISDDGRGFTADDDRGQGFGLAGMWRRVAQAGGELSVQSAPGAGTTVRLRLPIMGRQ